MAKTLDTLVEDIYALMKQKNVAKGVDVNVEIDKFGESMKDLMKKEFLPSQRGYDGGRKLRLSAIGKPDLQQWYSVNNYTGEKLQPQTLIKFMYGHMIEEFLLMLVRLTGHEVTDEQKQVSVGGVKGHMDCKIDGTVVDVKSTTSFGMKKFKDGTLAMSDDFGYVDQIKAYAHAEGDRKWAWLAMDKQNGTLAVLEYDLDDTSHPMYKYYSADIEERVAHVKKSVGQEDRPSPCSYPVPDGKSGNLKLSTMCSYCQYKEHCYTNLRAFAYSTGPKFLTQVSNLPKVPEINLNKR
jgi:hypothetical protein|tara:strand:- start:833 stop:1714 length:882 start_codon:yes stop_codon:yes gene_type:complete